MKTRLKCTVFLIISKLPSATIAPSLSTTILSQRLAIEELMANLEQIDRLKIAALLTDKEQPWTLVAVTDDAELASRCDRVIVLNEGTIVAEGSFEAIKKTVHFKRVFKIYNT